MSEERATITGVVGTVKQWASKKGFFLGLNGDENDYYGFGPCKAKAEDDVVLEVAPGEGTFADKTKILKLTVGKDKTGKAKVTDKAQLAPKEEDFVQGDNVYFNKDRLIVKEVCIKAAAELVGHTVERSKVVPGKNMADAVCEVAEVFFNWVIDADEVPEEAADEPDNAEEGG